MTGFEFSKAIYGSRGIPTSVQDSIDRNFAGPDGLASRQNPANLAETIRGKRDRAKAGQILKVVIYDIQGDRVGSKLVKVR